MKGEVEASILMVVSHFLTWVIDAWLLIMLLFILFSYVSNIA
jgi:hypothetical protein